MEMEKERKVKIGKIDEIKKMKIRKVKIGEYNRRIE
jgi:hypothetical protein